MNSSARQLQTRWGEYDLEHGETYLISATLLQVFSISDGLETPIQLIYLLTLLAFLAGGAFLVVRQVLIRRELDEGAKALGERIRTNEASCEDYFELGVILTRKRLFTQATKNLEKAKKVWDGEESELAQVHNALGYCYLNMERVEDAVKEYEKAVELQPGEDYHEWLFLLAASPGLIAEPSNLPTRLRDGLEQSWRCLREEQELEEGSGGL